MTDKTARAKMINGEYDPNVMRDMINENRRILGVPPMPTDKPQLGTCRIHGYFNLHEHEKTEECTEWQPLSPPSTPPDLELTRAEWGILEHSLGISDRRIKHSYRNYFACLDPGHADQPIIDCLVAKGLMEENPRQKWVFHVTDKGREILGTSRAWEEEP